MNKSRPIYLYAFDINEWNRAPRAERAEQAKSRFSRGKFKRLIAVFCLFIDVWSLTIFCVIVEETVNQTNDKNITFS